MWAAYIGAMLARLALPLAGVALALIMSLSVALWWTNNQLDKARSDMSVARASVEICIAANASQRESIRALQEAQERNRTQREAAIRRQQEAIQRVEQLERQNRNAETVERVIRVADGDLCAATPVPDRLRNAARRH